MKLLVFFAVVGVCAAEEFRGYGRVIPQIRFELPTEVKVTRENVVFAGQTTTRGDEVTGRAHKEYLPPAAQAPVPAPAPTPTPVEDDQQDIFKVQGLPRAEAGRQFSEDEPSPRTFESKSQQITSVSSTKFRGQEQNGFGRQFNEPPSQYGPPSDVQADTLITEADPNIQLQDDEQADDEYDEIPAAKNERPSIAIANSEVSQGQYFIVTPDNTLRHVQFRTSQSSDNDEFTAHLRYRPVNIYDYRGSPKAMAQNAEEINIDRN